MTFFPESELILNKDGSIYHLGLLPEHVADTIITVGDPDRVEMVTQHFERIEFKKSVREFVTHTGTYKNKRITVISTGIGTDNIDIVFNELDALVNIDFSSRTEKATKKALNIIRIGTSGALHKDLGVDNVLASSYGIDLGPLQHFYPIKDMDEQEKAINEGLLSILKTVELGHVPTSVTACSSVLMDKIATNYHKGATLTAPGFYGPQGRSLRGKTKLTESFFDLIAEAEINGTKITNFEMETAGIYTMASLLGHHALSINLLLANRQAKTFSTKANEGMNNLILEVLDSIAEEL